jgi:ribulose-5-phosphate 4-epimerase/fuculose-1-phosphate aldolase
MIQILRLVSDPAQILRVSGRAGKAFKRPPMRCRGFGFAWQGAPFRLCCRRSASQDRPPDVSDHLADVRYELALASRILANEGVLDAFGHVSLRHPDDPSRYLLSRSRSPQLVEPDDFLEFTLDSEPVSPPEVQLFAERVIHGCIFEARPDVMAVCHHHAPAVMPFAIADIAIVPVFHLGAAVGEMVPFWDQHDEFGDTNLLVVKPEEGRSLARALGGHAAVLMTHHGATVVGADLRELVSRTIFMCRNAEYQLQARLLGNVVPLSKGEARLAGSINAMPNVVGRTWEYWSMRLAEAGRLPPRTSSRMSAKSSRKASGGVSKKAAKKARKRTRRNK